MDVAFVSYECPPDTPDGGIGTYVQHATRMLSERGHRVEVFAASRHRTGTFVEDGVAHHRIIEPDIRRFAATIAPIFEARHRADPFDVVEGPDFGADAHHIIERYPTVPFVLRLHTPSGVLLDANFRERGFRRRLTLAARSVAKLRPPIWGIAPDHWRTYLALRRYDRIERSQATRADVVASPSQALATMMQRRWRLNRLTTLAYPFRPSSELLSTPANTNHRTVLFIGRLERRKGVLELAAAIPQVLSDHPDVVFRFVGPSDVSPERGVTMRDYLGALLAPHSDSVAIEDPVPMAGVPQLMRAADLVVLPSRWENFPYACLEAMSAARGIVASRAGGMREQLDDGSVGCLVNPDDPHGIAVAISQLMDDPDRRISLGEAARRRVLGHYGYDALVPSYEDVYRQAIARRRGLVADAS